MRPTKLIVPPKIKPKNINDYKEIYLQAEHGWLAPDGFLHQCLYGEHEKYSESHIYENKYNPEINSLRTGSQILEKHGWIKIQKDIAHTPDGYRGNEWFVTKAQFNFLNAYFHYRNKDDIGYLQLRIK